MKNYFLLQYKMLNRKMTEFGVHPILGYLLGIIAFLGISIYSCWRNEIFIKYIYGIIAIYFVSRLSEQERNDFLKMIFPTYQYKKIRIIENLIIAFLFIPFLMYQKAFLVAVALVIISLLLSVFNVNRKFNYAIPTPFGRRPFEFTRGFRRTFYVYPIAYFFTFQAITYSNINFGIFSMLLTGFIVLSYYLETENEYYVWVFNLSPISFLFKKIKTGLLYATFLMLPIIIPLSLYFQDNLLIIILFLPVCYIYIIMVILAKYSIYPNNMNVPENALIIFSMIFPPIVFAVIPFFYFKSIKRLKPFLTHD